MVDSKISVAQVAAGETFAGLNDEIAVLKKGKTVKGGAQFAEADSAGTSFTQDQFYGMPPNLFQGQTPLPSTVHAPPVPLVSSIGQTGAGGQTGYVWQNHLNYPGSSALVCRVTSRYNHQIPDRTSVPRTKASPEILQPQILQHRHNGYYNKFKALLQSQT
jgi:hypothetical protein